MNLHPSMHLLYLYLFRSWCLFSAVTGAFLIKWCFISTYDMGELYICEDISHCSSVILEITGVFSQLGLILHDLQTIHYKGFSKALYQRQWGQGEKSRHLSFEQHSPAHPGGFQVVLKEVKICNYSNRYWVFFGVSLQWDLSKTPPIESNQEVCVNDLSSVFNLLFNVPCSKARQIRQTDMK